MVETFDPVHLVLDLIPGRADAELEPSSGQVIDRDRKLGQHNRVAVGVAGDHAADAHTLGGLDHGGLERPTLVDGSAGAVRADGGQVIEVPHVVEAALVGDLPARAQLLDRDPLARGLQAEAKGMRHEDLLSVPAQAADADDVWIAAGELLRRPAEAFDLRTILPDVDGNFVRWRFALDDLRLTGDPDHDITHIVRVEMQLDVRVLADMAFFQPERRVDHERVVLLVQEPDRHRLWLAVARGGGGPRT